MDSYERHRKIAVDLLNPGTFFFPLLYTIGVSLRLPCLPSNFGFWMHPECLSWTNMSTDKLHPLLNFCIRVILAAVNFWIWSFGMHATCVVGSGVVMIGSMHFRCKLKRYKNQITHIRARNLQQEYKASLIYREIQLLARQYNQIHQRAIVTAVILAVVSTQSICVYALVEFHETMHWINKIFFGMMGMDCFMAIMMLCGTLADTYDVSVKILGQLKRKHRGFKWLYRFHRSCQAIKMRFGMTNFMEKLTPMNFENFSLCQTVNMLLVKE